MKRLNKRNNGYGNGNTNHIRMNNILTSILLFLVIASNYNATAQTIEIKKMSLNSSIGSDLAPFVIDSTIIFSSNRRYKLGVNYFDNDNDNIYKLFSAKIHPDGSFDTPKLYTNINTNKFNNICLSFSQDGSMAVWTQNQNTNINKTQQNLLGIYMSQYDGNNWSAPIPYTYNSDRNYSTGQATISPDGKTMVFVSDMERGMGETDLYICTFENGNWGEPKNMGNIINTPGKEVFPFFHSSGKLFFSSDGHNGSGGLDILYTLKSGDKWNQPIALDPPINSNYDDFSCFITDNEETGYFASNRSKNIDNIYNFSLPYPEFTNTQPQVEDYYCFTLFENSPYQSDTLPYVYIWNFGDGKTASGLEVDHCFPGPGKYQVKLDMIDSITNTTLFTVAEYPVILKKTEQIYISCPDTVSVGESITFNTDQSYLPNFSPKQFYWDFDDGNKSKGVTIQHIFRTKGVYNIKCGATSKTGSEKMCSTKNIVVID